MQTYKITEAKNIHIIGRTTISEEGLNIFWTGSGVEFVTDSTELHMEVEVDYAKYEPWVEIYVDGYLSQKLMLQPGKADICILRKMDAGKLRRIKVIKSTQPHRSDSRELFRICSISLDGEISAIPEYEMKIEVVGDSITSGEGLHGAIGEMSNVSAMFAVQGSYHSILGQRLNADVSVVSQCGYGVYCGWCGIRDESVPRYYESVCGVTDTIHDERTGSHSKWDFSSWQPDIVIVNLGTNDSNSFELSGQYIEDKDFTCPMRVNPDGSMHEEDRKSISDATVDFLSVIRKNNPDSHIIWSYGMIKGRLTETFEEAVRFYSEKYEDTNVSFLELPDTEKGGFGSRAHPGKPSHKKAAKVLTEYIREKVLNR